MLSKIGRNKIRVSRTGIALFNAQWPCSELRSTRAYWFEFDNNGDLIDTDVPEQDDGGAALAMAEDCKNYLFDNTSPPWALKG